MFLDPQDEVGPSISSSVVLRSFVLLVYIVVLVLVVCLCPSTVHVVATFSGTVLFPLLLFYFIYYILCSVHFIFKILPQHHVLNAFMIFSSFFPMVHVSDP